MPAFGPPGTLAADWRTSAPISVIIPTFNGARFLARTIGTVQAQTLQPAEIIVVDDGSDDNSAEVAASCGAKVVRQANGGICAARNTGIQKASQPWVALLDHDDIWSPEKLERQWQAVQHFPEAVLIVTDCSVVNDAGLVRVPSFAGREIVHYNRLSETRRSGSMVLHGEAYDELAQCGWFLMPSASLVRRDVLLDVGSFDVRTVRWEDTSCFLRVLKQGPLVFIREPLAKWVIHGTNSHRDTIAMHNGFLRLHDIMRAEPELYPASYRRKMDKERPAILLMLARAKLESGAPGAGRYALEAFRRSRSPRALALALVALAPVSTFPTCVRLWRWVRGSSANSG